MADNLPLYGVCCYMEEAVHRPPAMLNQQHGDFILPPQGRHLVAAPRCYCLLTHYPFFTLHFKVCLPAYCRLDWLATGIIPGGWHDPATA